MGKSTNDGDLDPDFPEARRIVASCAVELCPLEPRAVGTKMKNRPLCRDHHAAAMRGWRERRRAAGLPAAGASRVAPSSSRSAIRRRVALHRAIEAGKIERRPCADCGTKEHVLALLLDPDHPNLVTWRCRVDRHTAVVERERKRTEAADERARYAAYRAQAEHRRTALELLEAAPPEVQAAIYAEAAATMYGPMRLRPGMPLYQQRLAQLAETRLRLTVDG